MNDFFILIVICIFTCIFSALIKQYLKEQALLLVLTVICISVIKLANLFFPISNLLNEIFKDVNIDFQYYKILLKSLAISYVTKVGESICKDCNENSLAIIVQTSGKISMTITALPLFIKIIEILSEVLK